MEPGERENVVDGRSDKSIVNGWVCMYSRPEELSTDDVSCHASVARPRIALVSSVRMEMERIWRKEGKVKEYRLNTHGGSSGVIFFRTRVIY